MPQLEHNKKMGMLLWFEITDVKRGSLRHQDTQDFFRDTSAPQHEERIKKVFFLED